MKFLAELHESIVMSWDAIRANKMRSVLATIGIVVGIVTVTLMGAAINGLNLAFIKSIASLGAGGFYVQQYTWMFSGTYDDWLKTQSRRRPVELWEANELRRELGPEAMVAPEVFSRSTVKYKTRSATLVLILGTTESYMQASGVNMAQGRFLSAADCEGGQPICVVGSDVATNLFRGDDPLGARIKIADQSFQVVGVLEKQGTRFGSSLDNRAVIPIRAFLADIWSRPVIDTVLVNFSSLAQLDERREEVRQAMRHVRHLRPKDPDDFGVNQMDQIVQWFHRQTRTTAIVGMCVTSLALFVGGIGIMNIMFVSVVERTREIGVRKAMGAKRRSILLQFLIEAACICLLGGLMGLGIAWFGTVAVTHWLFQATMSWPIVVLSLLVSLMTGVVSGFLPAWRAARMDPVDALRSE